MVIHFSIYLCSYTDALIWPFDSQFSSSGFRRRNGVQVIIVFWNCSRVNVMQQEPCMLKGEGEGEGKEWEEKKTEEELLEIS